MKQRKIWIVVADAGTARILKPVPEDRTRFAEIGRLVNDRLDVPAGEIHPDRLGRSFESAAPARHAVEPRSDPVRRAKAAFADNVARRLEQGFDHGDFETLFVVAAPAMLGDLRHALPERLRPAIHGESDRDLVKLPDADLFREIAALIA
jgi:protein required for attachment to host cells